MEVLKVEELRYANNKLVSIRSYTYIRTVYVATHTYVQYT